MAMIDYGAMLKVDGNFINKNKELFMESSDTGYICKQAIDKNGNKWDIDGDYYVYAGDKSCLIAFYKCYLVVISEEKVIFTYWNGGLTGEEIFLDKFKEGLPKLKVEHLDKVYRKKYCMDPLDVDIDYVLNYYGSRKGKLIMSRYYKRIGMIKRGKISCYKYLSQRYVATWEWNNRKYECIFGYGIDPDEDTWNKIKYTEYDFSDEERQVIDEWFFVK